MVQIVESRFDVMCRGHQHFSSAPSRGVENGDFGPSKRATMTPCLLNGHATALTHHAAFSTSIMNAVLWYYLRGISNEHLSDSEWYAI
jgi:hypothetical protein